MAKLDPEVQVHVDAIANASGDALVAALEHAKPALGAKTFTALTHAAGDAIIDGRVTLEHVEMIIEFFLAAVNCVAEVDPVKMAVFGNPPLQHLERAFAEIVKTATTALPVAKRILDVLNDRLRADAAFGKQLYGLSGYFYFYNEGYEGPAIPFKSSGGVSTTDVIYARLDLTLALHAPREDLWNFCIKLVAKTPSARGLPATVKNIPVTMFTDFTLADLFALLRAGLAHEDLAVARVLIADALEQFERLAPAKKNVVSVARAAKLSKHELATFGEFLATQKKIGEQTTTLANTWAASAKDKRTAAALKSALDALGVAIVELPPATPKDVLIALHDKRWDDARAMLVGGVRMEDPGCEPEGAIASMIRAPDKIRFPLIELMFAQGLDVDDARISGATGLQSACYARDEKLARFLLEHGADVDADMDTSTGHSETSLHAAVERADEKIVKLLLEFGADPTIKNWNDETALDVAEDEIKELLTNTKPSHL